MKSSPLLAWYSSFCSLLTMVLGFWIALVFAGHVAVQLNLSDYESLLRSLSLVEVHSLRLRMGYDLPLTALFSIVCVPLFRKLKPQPLRVPAWVDLLAAVAGLGLALGLVYYPSMTISGRLPSFGLNPTRWSSVGLLVALILGSLGCIRCLLRRFAGRSFTFGRDDNREPLDTTGLTDDSATRRPIWRSEWRPLVALLVMIVFSQIVYVESRMGALGGLIAALMPLLYLAYLFGVPAILLWGVFRAVVALAGRDSRTVRDWLSLAISGFVLIAWSLIVGRMARI